jgi:hypothetical protein
MATEMLEERAARLEDLMADAWRAIEQASLQSERTERELDRFSRESRAETRASKEEMRASKKEMDKKWGELARKMGTMAEDLVAPNIPRILQDVMGCSEDQMEMMAVRVRRHHPVERGRSQEFDVVAVCGKYVLINETKSSLAVEAVQEFVALLTGAREFFPEYAGKKFVGAIASLYVDESVVHFGQKQGVLVLGMGNDLMDVLNEPGFKPAEF